MIERREHFGLALKPRQPLAIVSDIGGQHLDRDLALQLGIPGAIDLAHSAGAERRYDFVRTQLSAGRQGH